MPPHPRTISTSFLIFLFISSSTSIPLPQPPSSLLTLPSDAISLLSFKSTADLDHRLHFPSIHEPFDHCEWQGVKCSQGRVVRVFFPSRLLRGAFSPSTLSKLDQLRVLVLRNNSLSGPIPPDISRLTNLKTLLLDRNLFSAAIPPSLFSLYKLRVLDLSFNNLTGPVSHDFLRLDRLQTLRLNDNRLVGPIPALNQTGLLVFDVSGNNLTGEIPKTLGRFPAGSFARNPSLCGETINKPCDARGPFFASSSSDGNVSSSSDAAGSGGKTGPGDNSQSTLEASSSSSSGNGGSRGRKLFAIGLSLGSMVLFASFICFVLAARNSQRRKGGGAVIAGAAASRKHAPREDDEQEHYDAASSATGRGEQPSPPTIRVRLDRKSNQLTVKDKDHQQDHHQERTNFGNGGGNLVFCVGEAELYTLEQLMRASAEMLGRGTVGTTYKAKLESQLIVTVKRIDAARVVVVVGNGNGGGGGAEAFERHMEVVGALRHPNLVPVRAYFQAKAKANEEERLIIYDYQPNGSVFNLVHGSRSTRAKPLHWTSCLKIAEDVAQGLAYIHQASNLVHGNLKATNVLLGTDFEACLTDYCLLPLLDLSATATSDPNSARYCAPEARTASLDGFHGRHYTFKSDVYAFGVLLLELLSGKPPAEHPYIAPPDMLEWVVAMRDRNRGGGSSNGHGSDEDEENDRLRMLVEVASTCSLVSPEQRPTMSKVLRMIQKIKNSVVVSGGVGGS